MSNVSKKIKVWELNIFESKVLFTSLQDLLSSLECDLGEIDESEDLTIGPVWMSENKFSKLPEFNGY